MEEILDWLRQYTRGHRKDRDRILRLLNGLGNPQESLSAFQITGTNGKGSVAAMLHVLLHEHHVRAGLFTSPHLRWFRERIRVDGMPVADGVLREAQRAVEAAAVGMDCTGFEVITALAFWIFHRLQVPVAVLEVGVGGAGDPTRLAGRALATVLTSVALDHEDRIGPTLGDIAREKAGLIRPGVPTVVGPMETEAGEMIRLAARSQGSPLYRLGEDFQISLRRSDGEGTWFDWEGLGYRFEHLFVPLTGAFQATNAALALAAFLGQQGLAVDVREEAIRRALAMVRWPGRMDRIRQQPPVLLDGAHNEAAFATLRDTLRQIWPDRRWNLVLGTSRNHRLGEAFAALVRESAQVFLTRSIQEKAVDPEELTAWIPDSRQTVTLTSSVPDALSRALKASGPQDLVVVTGSLFVVGEAMEVFQVDTDSVIRSRGH